uniref:Uncharacterized protein n=1 Tax=Arundo donax TaxID=35708 RepID=A0A0A8ZUL4_ARUDO
MLKLQSKFPIKFALLVLIKTKQSKK